MPLFRFNDFDSIYQNTFGRSHIQRFHVYTPQNEKVGQVMDALIDDGGRFQHLVVALDPAIANKQVLLPMQQARIDQQKRRVYLDGLSVSQVTNLPTPDSKAALGATTEPRTRPPQEVAGSLENSALLEDSAPLEGWVVRPVMVPVPSASTVVEPKLDSDPSFYQTNAGVSDGSMPTSDISSQLVLSQEFASASPDMPAPTLAHPPENATIRLLEERLVVDRGQRRKVGEVIVRKEIETHIIQVPVRREKLIVEQISPDYQQLAVVDLGEHVDDPQNSL